MRIREDVLERDYCLAWFLSALSGSDLKPALAFKGGTALKRCYFADYRFSEDLDFTLREPLSFEEIRARLAPVYAMIQEQSGIVFTFDRQDPRVRVNTHTFYLRYIGPLPGNNDVKVDITINEVLSFPLEDRPILRGYPEFADLPENRTILVREKPCEGLQDGLARKEARYRALWNTRLSYQMATLPPFDQVFREMRRTFRQANLP